MSNSISNDIRMYTVAEVAKIMGVSQVQISRIEKKLLGTLRQNIG